MSQFRFTTILQYLKESNVNYNAYGDTRSEWIRASLDSRECKKGTFFIGIQGEYSNGGEFIDQALKAGSNIVLVEQQYITKVLIEQYKRHALLIGVEDGFVALKKLVMQVRINEARDADVIAVTGSTGKTTTKNLLATMLEGVYSKGNLNTMQGLSLTLLNISWKNVKYAILECGISKYGEMEHLVEVLRPDYAIVTNVENSHLAGFKDKNELQNEKLSIAKGKQIKAIWVPEEDIVLQKKVQSLPCEIKLHGEKSCKGLIQIRDEGIYGFSLEFQGLSFIKVPLLGDVNARNSITALQVARFLGVSHAQITKRITCMRNEKRRYQILHEKPYVIDDSYNSNAISVISAIRWVSSLPMNQIIYILGGIKELGIHTEKEHKKIINELYLMLQDMHDKDRRYMIFLLGNEYSNIFIERKYRNIFYKIENIEDKISYIQKSIQNLPCKDTLIFIKGSNFYHLSDTANEIVKSLESNRDT